MCEDSEVYCTGDAMEPANGIVQRYDSDVVLALCERLRVGSQSPAHGVLGSMTSTPISPRRVTGKVIPIVWSLLKFIPDLV